MDRAILHCDMNNFYASVECALDPSIKDSPVAVCGSESERHGIVLARNYKARDKGVVVGDTIWKARNKCENLVVVDTPHFDKYLEYSEKAFKIYERYTDYIEPMGIDECWLDVTNSTTLFGAPKKIADELRSIIKKELNVTISVGVSFNKTFAKLGSDLKKPDATTVISRDNFKEIVWPLPVSALFGVGRNTYKVLKKYYIETVGDLAKEKKERLQYLLGKNGVFLYNVANGLEDEEVAKSDLKDSPKSVSHGITTVKDLNSDEEVWKTMLNLTQEISWKLRKYKLRAGGVSVSIRDSMLMWHQWQKKLKSTEQSAVNIAKIAYNIFIDSYDWAKPVRNVTISTMYLTSDDSPVEMTIFDDFDKKLKVEKIESVMEKLNNKYGSEVMTLATLLEENYLPESRRRVKYSEKKNDDNN